MDLFEKGVLGLLGQKELDMGYLIKKDEIIPFCNSNPYFFFNPKNYPFLHKNILIFFLQQNFFFRTHMLIIDTLRDIYVKNKFVFKTKNMEVKFTNRRSFYHF